MSAAGGSFSGNISGASGTFTGDLSGSNISGGTIDIGGSDSTSFHVDSDGNLFLGASTFGSAPFKVSNAGALTATSVAASDVFVSGVAITPSLLTSPVVMDDDSELKANLTFDSAGVIRTSSGSNRVQLSGSGSSQTFIDFIKSSSTTGRIFANADEFVINAYNSGDVLILRSEIAGTGTTNLEQGTLNISGGTNIVTTVGTSIDFGGNIGKGASGSVLTSNANGMSWQATSGHSHGNISFPNSGTVLSTSNHSHTANDVTNLGNNNVLTNNNHTHINVLTNNSHSHGNTMAPNNHNHNFNADITGFNHNNEVGHHTHNFTVAEDPHGNNEHNASFATNSQVDTKIAIHNAQHHSDYRLKENVQPISLGLDFVETLKPVDFKWKTEYLDETIKNINIENDWKKNRTEVLSNVQQGFIAQDLQKAVYDFTGSNNSLGAVYKKNYTDKEQRDYKDDELGHVDMQQLVPVLVKSIQQLSAKIKVLEAQVDELGGV